MKTAHTFKGFSTVACAMFALAFLMAAPGARAHENTDDGDDLRWPRTIKQGGASLVIYQPQIEKWDDGKVSARAAVAVTPAGSTKESFGTIELTARTEVDKDNHIVTFEDVAITNGSFPVDKANEPINTESTYDWNEHQWTVPINLQVSQILKIGPLPISLQAGPRFYADGPSGGPDWGFRVTLTFLFPKWTDALRRLQDGAPRRAEE